MYSGILLISLPVSSKIAVAQLQTITNIICSLISGYVSTYNENI